MGRLAIPSGRVLPTVGFAAWPGALGLGGRWPDAGAPDRDGRVSAALNRMLRARAATANATAIRGDGSLVAALPGEHPLR